MTDFIRNAANLAQLPPKTSKNDGNEDLKNVVNAFLGSLKMYH
jgi:hypothetical protein